MLYGSRNSRRSNVFINCNHKSFNLLRVHDALFDRKAGSTQSPAEELFNWLTENSVSQKEAKTALVDLEKVQII